MSDSVTITAEQHKHSQEDFSSSLEEQGEYSIPIWFIVDVIFLFGKVVYSIWFQGPDFKTSYYQCYYLGKRFTN